MLENTFPVLVVRVALVEACSAGNVSEKKKRDYECGESTRNEEEGNTAALTYSTVTSSSLPLL
jgi:NADH:ubiquinone oxidoreductase subunit 3 (subunit A)